MDAVGRNPSPGVKNRKNRLNAKKRIEIQTRKLLKPSIDAGFYGKTNLRNNRAKLTKNRPVTGQDKLVMDVLGQTPRRMAAELGYLVGARRF